MEDNVIYGPNNDIPIDYCNDAELPQIKIINLKAGMENLTNVNFSIIDTCSYSRSAISICNSEEIGRQIYQSNFNQLFPIEKTLKGYG